MEKTKSSFDILSEVDMSPFVTKKKVKAKSGYEFTLDYLSWAHAWDKLKRHYPNSKMIIYENDQGWPYFTDGKTGWVKISITIDGSEIKEYYPILGIDQKSKRIDDITSFDVNTALQRGSARCIARHGLGINIYTRAEFADEVEDKKEVKIEMVDNSGDKITPIQLEGLQELYRKSVFSMNDQGVRDIAYFIAQKFGAKTFNDIAQKNISIIVEYLTKNERDNLDGK